jgi:antitoxin (DNA-binding transcriptional repressor) of toxin-antitoxin stability system
VSTVTLQEAHIHLPELIEHLAPGDGVTITKNDRPVARLVMVPNTEAPRPVPGRCRGMLTILAEDNEHLKDFAEQMP